MCMVTLCQVAEKKSKADSGEAAPLADGAAVDGTEAARAYEAVVAAADALIAAIDTDELAR